MAKIQDGRIPVIAQDYPSFLFSEYNENDIAEGLLQGYFLVRASDISKYFDRAISERLLGLQAHLY